ncbi:MAG: Ribosomal RNA small subunit methyltransferase H [Candidatus Moranbacteria bacterium GW2011_GWC2_37_73]|nr:MAG: Ribosomal RNA small subunit methyltransferase H [Parcubacteria group bacterium GW2011_GWC1_36_108]KKQ00071.1 MAG: Ribosomal RNA small subunit methyltransferase H [Candidatus Moranbacteria bacterium GW2011_GWD1_36_198]KKQ01146.1 MAG: Ribosomal RNA small subunit methyltransferase H [Candidatus Moranbacteria bacterium GW2011_GWD2_36_198]KKQ39944.1 MAG: Ribosomal RNA small subunit methyltransferase H [Candidatus Moranbacteria bacterium GW2011_GWC2_37_73]HAR99693.1 16S rRNA (cytosine(1402)-N
MQSVHKTVLLMETIEALQLKPGMIVVDATLGGGGHSLEVLKKIGKTGKLIAFDRDIDAIDRFKKRIEVGSAEVHDENIKLFHDNYSALKDRLTSIDIFSVDAILADLGISSDQLVDEKRGISFQGDSPLDMRMDMTKGITAAEIVNTYDEQDLIRVLKEFGDEKYASSIVRNIIAERSIKPFSYTAELVEIIERSVPGMYKRKKIHPATKTFQALRIEVNKELEALSSFLSQAVEILKTNGRLAIITFHSGEDALVKWTLRENARGCICPPEFPVCRCQQKPIVELITRKPIVPSENEVLSNPRARSAKLRVAERV